jgi:hypothetical protein
LPQIETALHPVTIEPGSGVEKSAHCHWARLFSLVALFLGLTYLVWLGRLALLSRAPLDASFFIAEILSYSLLCLLCYSIWFLRPNQPEEPESYSHFSVDIFIPVVNP